MEPSRPPTPGPPPPPASPQSPTRTSTHTPAPKSAIQLRMELTATTRKATPIPFPPSAAAERNYSAFLGRPKEGKGRNEQLGELERRTEEAFGWERGARGLEGGKHTDEEFWTKMERGEWGRKGCEIERCLRLGEVERREDVRGKQGENDKAHGMGLSKKAPAQTSGGLPDAKEGARTEAVDSKADAVKREDSLRESFNNVATVQSARDARPRRHDSKGYKRPPLHELKEFGRTFRLSTPIPEDIVGILTNIPERQKELVAKALKNANTFPRKAAATHGNEGR